MHSVVAVKRILVVDDAVSVGRLMTIHLRKPCNDITEVADAATALNYIARGSHVELIPADVYLPDDSGIALAGRIHGMLNSVTIPLRTGDPNYNEGMAARTSSLRSTKISMTRVSHWRTHEIARCRRWALSAGQASESCLEEH